MPANALFYHGQSSPSQAREALVAVAIETALLVAGDGIYKMVSDLLANTYNCKITDCYKYPQYLNTVFSKLGAETRSEIINTIRKELDEYSYMKPVSSFLHSLENITSA